MRFFLNIIILYLDFLINGETEYLKIRKEYERYSDLYNKNGIKDIFDLFIKDKDKFSKILYLSKFKHYIGNKKFNGEIKRFSIIDGLRDEDDLRFNLKKDFKYIEYYFSNYNFDIDELFYYSKICHFYLADDIYFFKGKKFFEDNIKEMMIVSTSTYFFYYVDENDYKNIGNIKKFFGQSFRRMYEQNKDVTLYFEKWDESEISKTENDFIFSLKDIKDNIIFSNNKYNHFYYGHIDLRDSSIEDIMLYGEENVFSKYKNVLTDVKILKQVNIDLLKKYLREGRTTTCKDTFEYYEFMHNLNPEKYKNIFLYFMQKEYKLLTNLEIFLEYNYENEDIEINENEIIIFGKKYKHYGTERSCSICLEEFEDYKKFKFFSCGHSYCTDCYKKYGKCVYSCVKEIIF
jgi:hypothetical protein